MVDEKDLHALKQWFHEYVDPFYTGDAVRDEPIRIKEDHTVRVCEEALLLGGAMHLSPQDILRAQIMALFHDIGRFEQYRRYGTFKDAESENHATLGLKELKRHHVLDRCCKEERAVIYTAIAFHNRRFLPCRNDERTLFFARLLRDADKLDILRVFVHYYEGRFGKGGTTITWNLPDRPGYAPGVVQALCDGKMADARDMVTLSDYKLLQISWIYDLNFPETCREIYQRRYIERIVATLAEPEAVQGAIEKATGCLADRMESTTHISI